MIAIVDYGMGNLRSVSKAFESVGHQAVVTRDPVIIRNASHVVLPGVGAFGDCMANLERFGLVESIRSAIQSGKPFLGICLGLQLLFTESEEFGVHKGFNIIPGKVRRFARDPALKIPHMGWNQVHIQRTVRSSGISRTAPIGISCIPISSIRPTLSWRPPPRPTACRLCPRSGRTISSPANSIPKRANPWVCG